MIAEKTKEYHEESLVELGKLQEQAAKREAELQWLLEERCGKNTTEIRELEAGPQGLQPKDIKLVCVCVLKT